LFDLTCNFIKKSDTPQRLFSKISIILKTKKYFVLKT